MTEVHLTEGTRIDSVEITATLPDGTRVEMEVSPGAWVQLTEELVWKVDIEDQEEIYADNDRVYRSSGDVYLTLNLRGRLIGQQGRSLSNVTTIKPAVKENTE